ncbi:MAG: hypothetical protein ACKVHH_03865 [Candidatus Poseidoniales archaeon]|jgi:hypothetical protein|tara:strand:+ start:1268 stop:1603 length:336 start_codon:yes stop_codon:yes gene_type:complete
MSESGGGWVSDILVQEMVDWVVSPTIKALTGMGLGTVITIGIRKARSDKKSKSGRTFTCGLCGAKNDHYKVTCSERFCVKEDCECEDADCDKYSCNDTSFGCACCVEPSFV